MFPALSGSERVYLNTGTSGPPPRSVMDAMHATDEELYGPLYLEGPALLKRQKASYDRAREAAAQLIGCGPDDVALTQNTTHGMNLGAHALDWQEGDEVLSAPTEHPGCLVPIHTLKKRYGVNLKLLTPPITPKRIEASLSPRVRMIALSHVDWTTGEVLPLEEISALARERGVVTLIDGAQSVGNISVDVPATGADMYAFTGHKWLLGPEGMGALYVRPELETHSTSVGFAALPDPSVFEPEGGYDLRPGARRFEASTMSPTLAAGFTEAADAAFKRGEAGTDEIRRRADFLYGLLAELPRVGLRSPSPAQSGLVSFEIEGMESKKAAELLLEKQFVVRYLPEPASYIRASTHLFNSEEELEAFAGAVSELTA